ncbi:hypothetical protein ABT173_35810 [Streptomyces sp. NPDC001795]|uniref:hypothetical protein n=1 Tax=Streptomyces sp. NPDC001795 TaxID=3154525 RepID=UPI00332A3681
MLAAVSEALWEPDPQHVPEPHFVRAERLRKITAQGDRLRARWAETAALEEAYSAPSSAMTQRQLKARSSSLARLQQRLIAQRVSRRRRITLLMTALGTTSVLLAVVMGFLCAVGAVSFWAAAATVTVSLANTLVTIAAHLRLAIALSEARNTARLLRHVSRKRSSRGSAKTEETPMATPD